MFRLVAGLAVVLAGFGGAAPLQAGDRPADGLNIEVVQSLFRDVPQGMVKVLGRPLRELIRKRTGLTGDVSIASDALTLADRLKTNQCQLGVFHGFEFAWAKERNADLIPLVVTVYPSGHPQACVVVRTDNPAATLGQLKSVAVPKGTKAHCLAYLDKQRAKLSEGVAAPNGKGQLSAEEALDGVVSAQCEAALVDISALAGYQKLQPGAFKRLRILCESDKFPQNVIAYSKGAITDAEADQLREVLTGAHTTPTGKPLMMLWSITRFAAVPADYQAQLDKCAKSYPTPTKREVAEGGR
jgi:ABC-type phosphate/phosphonate transport system substrate-binding protein